MEYKKSQEFKYEHPDYYTTLVDFQSKELQSIYMS